MQGVTIVGLVIALVLSSACTAETVRILGEDVQTEAEYNGQTIVTNKCSSFGEIPFECSVWQFTKGNGDLISVRKVSKEFERSLSGVEKRRMMASIQREFVPQAVGQSSMLKEIDDNHGEISTDEGVVAKVCFAESADGDRMIVDVCVNGNFIRSRKRMRNATEPSNECTKKALADFVTEVFNLDMTDLSTNGVGACKQYAKGKYEGFRFAKPRKLQNGPFNTLLCSYNPHAVLQRVVLTKLVSGNDAANICAQFVDSEEKDLVRKLIEEYGETSHIVNAPGRSVTIGSDRYRIKIEAVGIDSRSGVVNATVELLEIDAGD